MELYQTTHKKLVSALNLVNQAYAADDLKGLKGSDNPLDPVNDIHDRLKKFLNAHSGFNRDSLQDYLNLFAFVRNPPCEMLEKVEKVVNLAFQNPKFLRYRDQFGLNKGVEAWIISTVQVRGFLQQRSRKPMRFSRGMKAAPVRAFLLLQHSYKSI